MHWLSDSESEALLVVLALLVLLQVAPWFGVSGRTRRRRNCSLNRSVRVTSAVRSESGWRHARFPAGARCSEVLLGTVRASLGAQVLLEGVGGCSNSATGGAANLYGTQLDGLSFNNLKMIGTLNFKLRVEFNWLSQRETVSSHYIVSSTMYCRDLLATCQ